MDLKHMDRMNVDATLHCVYNELMFYAARYEYINTAAGPAECVDVAAGRRDVSCY